MGGFSAHGQRLASRNEWNKMLLPLSNTHRNTSTTTCKHTHSRTHTDLPSYVFSVAASMSEAIHTFQNNTVSDTMPQCAKAFSCKSQLQSKANQPQKRAYDKSPLNMQLLFTITITHCRQSKACKSVGSLLGTLSVCRQVASRASSAMKYSDHHPYVPPPRLCLKKCKMGAREPPFHTPRGCLFRHIPQSLHTFDVQTDQSPS